MTKQMTEERVKRLRDIMTKGQKTCWITDAPKSELKKNKQNALFHGPLGFLHIIASHAVDQQKD